MRTLEKILIPLYVLGVISVELLWELDLIPRTPARVAAYMSVVTLIALCLTYIIKFKFSVYSIGLVLLALYPLSNLFVLKGWDGVVILRLCHYASNYLFAFVFLKAASDSFNADKKFASLIGMVGILLVAQSIGLVVMLREIPVEVKVLNYVIVTVIILSKLKPLGFKQEENKVLNVIGLQSGTFVLIMLADTF